MKRLWQEAISHATRKHQSQFRKDGRTPYIAHPMRVMMVLRDVFGVDDEVVLAAAVLHDTIEDTTADYDEIEEHFGSEVADIVAAMSKDMRVPWERREEEYLAQLAAFDWRAKMIKLADVFDNLCDAPAFMRIGAREKAGKALALAKGIPELADASAEVRALLDAEE